MKDLSSLWCSELKQFAHPEKIKILSSFFKTGKGEYGEGDRFIGIKVPDNRSVAKKYRDADFSTIERMLESPVHEFRLAGFLALVEKYRLFAKGKNADSEKRDETVDFYILNSAKANNWDLVDLSAPYILGQEIAASRKNEVIEEFLTDTNLWRNRITVVSMLALVRCDMLELPLSVCKRTLSHPHALMKKATGWILREVYKKDADKLLSFLHDNMKDISAITLSYAIEKLPKEEQAVLRRLRKDTKASRV